VHPLSSNRLDMVLLSLPGLEYRIDASSDLLNWAAVTNFISTNAAMCFMDSSARNYGRRFYRAVVRYAVQSHSIRQRHRHEFPWRGAAD
jgi:hypothetical protein